MRDRPTDYRQAFGAMPIQPGEDLPEVTIRKLRDGAGTAISEREFEPPLDAGIERVVLILREQGIETFESCEGGVGHAFPVPTVRFHGEHSEGFRAFAIAQCHALPVSELRRVWDVIAGEPEGPHWEMTFRWTAAPDTDDAEV